MNYLDFAVQSARDEFQPVEAAIQADADEMDSALVTPPPTGPNDYCADFARVEACDDVTDLWICPFCGFTWSTPCR